MKAKLTDAPECLNTNDKAMWVLGYNEAIAAYEAKLREENEPVAWSTSDGLVKLLTTISCWTLVQKSEDAGFDTPLYTNPAPIPEGYALVPLKPNEAMLHHMMGCITHSADTRRNHYKMLLAAARSGE